MVHLDEVRPGLGNLDYATFLRGLDRLDPDIPIMLEHLATEEEYDLAARYVRSVAKEEGIEL
jgi:sugar phosphate isomerase/epimerase